MKKAKRPRRNVKTRISVWTNKIRREGIKYPDVFPKLRWVGRPAGLDSFHLVGMNLELVWFNVWDANSGRGSGDGE